MTFLRRLPLAGLAVLAAAALVPAAQPAAGDGPARAAPPRALDAVPRDGFLVVTVDVAKLWDHPAMQPARNWFAAQKEPNLEALVGVAPADLERVTFYMPVLSPGAEPAPLLLVTTRRPYNEARVVKHLAGRNGTPPPPGRGVVRVGNMVHLGQHGSPFQAAVLADERTLVLFPAGRGESPAAGVLVAQLLTRRADGPLAPALAAAGGSVVTIGLDPRQLTRAFAGDPGGATELAPYQTLFRATGATLTADLGGAGLTTRLSLAFATPEDARRAGPVLEEGLADLTRLADAAVKRQAERGDSGALEAAVFGVARDLLKTAKVEVKGAAVVASAEGPSDAALGQLVATLPKQVAAARRSMVAQNNLKQILLSLHNYSDTYGFLPSDVAPDRKTAFSWRVQILPFIEEGPLFSQLDMQLPWDHPRNKAVLEKAPMPKVFEVPGRPAPPGHTYWRSFSLPKKTQPKDGRPWLVEGERGVPIAAIPDGTSNTIAVVEAGESVPWYAPDQLPYDGRRPLPPLGAKGGDGFLAGMGDGSVRVIRAKTDEAVIRAAITRDGGEVLSFPDR